VFSNISPSLVEFNHIGYSISAMCIKRGELKLELLNGSDGWMSFSSAKGE